MDSAILVAAGLARQPHMEPKPLLELEGSVLTRADSTPIIGAGIVLFDHGRKGGPRILASTKADSTGSYRFRVRIDSGRCERLEILARALGIDHGMVSRWSIPRRWA